MKRKKKITKPTESVNTHSRPQDLANDLELKQSYQIDIVAYL